jgi:hypothetical protein
MLSEPAKLFVVSRKNDPQLLQRLNENISKLAALQPADDVFGAFALAAHLSDLVRSEVPNEIISAKIRMASAYCFDVSVGTIKQLRSSGVPDQIILAMVRRGEKGGL